MSKHRWTAEEDSVLVSQVKQHPNNLQDAFKAVGAKLGLPKSSCQARWYYISKKKGVQAAFLTMTEKKAFRNRKVVLTPNVGKHQVRRNVFTIIFNHLKNIF